MSFGQKILEKYGFKDGDGLGKNGTGIKTAIKANFKFDNAGLGDKGPVREDHWWERVFNEASSNVNIQKSDCGQIEVELHDKEGVEITNKSFSMKKLKKASGSLQYGSFLKSATLLANVGKEEDIDGHIQTNDIEIKPVSVLSDEDLFNACGGRTAHKGARHGLNLTGKLQRIAEQERILLEKMKGKQNKHEVFREPYAKKIKKNPLAELNSSKEEESDETPLEALLDTNDYVLKASRKRKKRDKKEELQLVTKIESIGLSELSSSSTTELDQPTEHEEDSEVPVRNGTPIRKKKKSKKVLDKLCSIEESATEPSSEDQIKRKKKKNKRKLNDEDEVMHEEQPRKEKSAKKAKKVKLDNSYEASESDEDTADKINAEQESMQVAKKLKKKAKKREKLRLKNAYEALLNTNL